MTELTESNKRPFSALTQNPITIKELRSRMRGRRAFVILTVYLLAMSSLIALVYLAYGESSTPYSSNASDAGKAVFTAVLAVQVFLVLFVGPASTAGAISGEKERQTYDLLRTTLLTPRALVLGKLTSALSYVFLLIFASIPLQSIAFLLGGVSLSELLISQLLILVAAVTFAMFGLYASSVMRTTLAASILTFSGSLFITLFLPLIVLLIATIIVPLFGALSWISDAALQAVGILLAATNLPATLILSDIILLTENSLLFFPVSFGSHTIAGYNIWLISPWPLFLIIYTLLALLLFWLCVRRIRCIADS